MNEASKESAFLVTNASGRHINLLNDNESHRPIIIAEPSTPSSEISDETVNASSSPSLLPTETQNQSSSKRKYHCTEPGCTKSFTTSGHLARHNRIHTGEKNFPCLFPGCLSRFSRQDNMMQHYRTHMSPKSRRTQKKVISEDLHPRPRLHAHQRIRSDPYRVERPLTIDQHLNNYRRSLLAHPSSVDRIASSVKYNMPTPLGAVAASHMQKQQLQQSDYMSFNTSTKNMDGTWSIEPVAHESSSRYNNDEMEESVVTPASELPTPSPPTPDMMFYQHKPLTFTKEIRKRSSLPFTLLHPTNIPSETSFDLSFQKQQQTTSAPPLSSSFASSSITTIPGLGSNPANISQDSSSSRDNDTNNSSSQAGLLQLAHIVSTFG